MVLSLGPGVISRPQSGATSTASDRGDMPTFAPPTRTRYTHSPEPLRITVQEGTSVLKVGSRYVPAVSATDSDVAAATVIYLGGHTYPITQQEADALTAAGYTVN